MALITLYGILCPSRHVSIRVWGIVYLNTAYQGLSQINELLHTFFLYIAERSIRFDLRVMPLTYKILKIEQNEGIISVDDTPVIELELTDLNSEKAFKIKVRIITPKTKPEIGIVFDGPTNWINRSVEIHHYDKKPIESWKVDDWLFDENPLNK